MIHALSALSWLAKTTGIFFPFWLRLPAILADAGSLWVVIRIFEPRLQEPSVRWGLLLFALSPALILVSGFHGNTDSVVMFFLLLSVWRGERDADWQSGAALGAAMCVKILPLVVLPVLFFSRPAWRRRIVFLASASAVIVIAWSPYLFRDPAAIHRQVMGYSSIYGHWGLTWLVWYMPFFRASWQEAFQHGGAYATLAIVTAAAWALNRSPKRPSVYTQTGATFFFCLAVANGFGVQYLAWLVPWTVGIAIIPVAFFTLASAAFLLAVYNFWAGGFPWFLADSNYVGDFVPHLDYLLTLCWISVIVLAIAVWKRGRALMPARGILLAFSALAIPLIVWPLWNQVVNVDSRKYPAADDRAALPTIRADEYAALSEAYYKMGRYADAVVAARTGVAFDPAGPDPWTRIALACIPLKRWDEALNAATTAVSLAPDNEAANRALAELRARR